MIPKSEMNEAEIRLHFIDPAIYRTWPKDCVRLEFPVHLGRIIVDGRKAKRATVKNPDYVLFHNNAGQWFPLAVVEAKRNDKTVLAGMGQARKYAKMMKAPFAFSSNGDAFAMYDMETGEETTLGNFIPMDQFPSPDELWSRYRREHGITPAAEELLSVPYHYEEDMHEPRYYQWIAINKVIEAIANGRRRMLICFQIINSVVPLVLLSIHYILFSSSIQARERALTIHNQALHVEAGTDPLTGLPNRRALLDVIENYRKTSPDSQFTVAIADIDFFKRVNDTYGHNCGDYTLKTLSQLFLDKAGGKYTVCRWGGEEFCFFIPEMNVDQAAIVMQDVHAAVGKMPLHFGEIDFGITITIGVEENDFHSSMEEIFNRADRKLYMGKAHGRNQVVI